MNPLTIDQRRSLELLHDACANCASTLRSAGEMVEAPALRSRCLDHAAAWRETAADLRRLIQDGRERSGTVYGILLTLGRTWLKVKSAVGDTQAIMAECHRRERDVRKRIEAAQSSDLPADIRAGLQEIQQRLDRMSTAAGSGHAGQGAN